MCILALTTQGAIAKKADLEGIVTSSTLNKNATIAVSVKNAKTGAAEYEYNQDKLLHPASVLKIVTLPASLDTLTPGYVYETKLGLDKDKNMHIKLSGDPLLSGEQLKYAVRAVPEKELNNIFIDDKVFDRYEWGIGWMWDDETNPRMAKVSPYNFKQNLLNIKVLPTTPNAQAKVFPDNVGAASIVNMVTTGTKNELVTYRQNSMSPNILYVYGTVAAPQTLSVPVGNPERNFIINLDYHLKAKNITHMPESLGAYPADLKEFYSIKNSIGTLIPEILQNSNNFYAETLFKTAGAINAKAQGTFANSEKMFKDYYKKSGLNPDKIILADASGVSRNNLFSADWISEALYKIQKDKNFELIKTNMARPGEGTMKNRLPELAENLSAKTGTLSNISTIAGYVTDKNGEEHIFTIMVENFCQNPQEALNLQDKIITEIYKGK